MFVLRKTSSLHQMWGEFTLQPELVLSLRVIMHILDILNLPFTYKQAYLWLWDIFNSFQTFLIYDFDIAKILTSLES